MPRLDERPHEAEQQGEQQRPDVLTVDVGVRHEDDLVVAQLADVEVVVDPSAKCGNERLDLIVLQYPVYAVLLDMEDLAADRQDRVDQRIATTLGRTSGRVSLHDDELAASRIGELAVGKLARQRA